MRHPLVTEAEHALRAAWLAPVMVGRVIAPVHRRIRPWNRWVAVGSEAIVTFGLTRWGAERKCRLRLADYYLQGPGHSA